MDDPVRQAPPDMTDPSENGEKGQLRPYEVHRKLIHLSSSVVPLALLILPADTGTALAAAALVGAIIVDLVRLRWEAFGRFLTRYLGMAMRPHEADELTGSTFLCLAALVCIVLFPMPITVSALFFLTLGDTAAALIGQRWGRTPLIPGKTLEGTLACLLTCTIVVILMPGIPLTAGLAGAFVATAVELFGTAAVDDNFGIPVLSALTMWIVASLVV
ncbi:MAG: SEC59/DGK1/VTE5 family protein [bacterium]